MSLDIATEAVICALDVLSSNRLAFHPVSDLALRMRMSTASTDETLKSLEPALLESIETHGERCYALTSFQSDVQTHLMKVLDAFRSDRARLRNSLGQQSEVHRLRNEFAFNQDLMGTILEGKERHEQG